MKHTPKTIGGLAIVFGFLITPTMHVRADAGPVSPLPAMRTYTQELTIEFASSADAAKAQIAITPVYQGKQWAFSARWDDNSPNNLPVHAVMARQGIGGTFYLNESRGSFRAEYARKLTRDGIDIGGHTQTHRLLHGLLPNEVFYEILANRVQREAETDRPMNAFAFPGGVWNDRADPITRPTITQSVLRAGFLICPYADFVLKNPDMPVGAMFTGHQVGPGDHKVDAQRFDTLMERILKDRKGRTKQSYLIHMGVHARQTGEELNKLEAVMQKYGRRPDWWYCTMTDYAGYARQAAEAKIEPLPGNGAVRKYRITRIAAGDINSAIPLTIEITGGAVKSATGDGFACTPVESADRTLFDLHHTPDRSVPTVIDAIDNTTNAPDPVYPADAPAVRGWLVRVSDEQLRLTLHNTSDRPVDRADVTLRLPPLYLDGLRKLDPITLAAGEQKVIDVPLGPTQSEPSYNEGAPYFVAEVDYRSGDALSRLFVTTRLATQGTEPCLRDAVRMLGPIAEDEVQFDNLAEQSKPGATLADMGTLPTQQWFVNTAAQRAGYKPDRASLYREDHREWRTLAGKFDFKPQSFLLAFDFTVSRPTTLTLSTDAAVVGVLLDGATAPAGKEIAIPTAGKHRLLLHIRTQDNRQVWTAYPLYLRIRPQSGTLQFEVIPPAG